VARARSCGDFAPLISSLNIHEVRSAVRRSRCTQRVSTRRALAPGTVARRSTIVDHRGVVRDFHHSPLRYGGCNGEGRRVCLGTAHPDACIPRSKRVALHSPGSQLFHENTGARGKVRSVRFFHLNKYLSLLNTSLARVRASSGPPHE